MIRYAMLIGILLVGPLANAADDDLKSEVRRLVRQLDAPQLVQREAVEAELLRAGPAALDLLPPANDRMTAEVRQRLDRVRQKLQQAAADSVADASVITLHADAMRLSTILEAFQTQSGNTMVDFRRQFGQPANDPKLTVDFDKTPFWPAIDQILDRAKLTVYPYAKQRGIGVVSVPGEEETARVGRASYRGPFRFEAVSIVARRNLRQANGDSLLVGVEVMWEPRLRVISLMQQMADVTAADERGRPLPMAASEAKAEVPDLPIGGAPVCRCDFRRATSGK